MQSNRDKKLDLDPTQLSFENLKYLVDSEVKLSELAYAQQNRISYSQFADAFFSIQYDTARIGNTHTVYNWPYTSYTLSDILEKGGICIDQAYYAEILGKGRGIPTIRFTGYGMDGAHAWFGYLSNSGKWELDCGRYEEQDFPKGFAVDPQTWQPHRRFGAAKSLQERREKSQLSAGDDGARLGAPARERCRPTRKFSTMRTSIMPEWSGTWRLQADAGGQERRPRQEEGVLPGLDQPVRQLIPR